MAEQSANEHFLRPVPNERVLQVLETFKKDIQPFIDQWRSLDIRAVTMKDGKVSESSFQNLATTITLLPSPPKDAMLHDDLPDLGWLKAVHEGRPIEDLGPILSKLGTDGAIKIKETEIAFVSKDSSVYFAKNQRGEGYTSSPTDWTYYSLTLDSKFACSFDPRKTDEQLKGAASPFLSLDALIREFPLWRGGWGNVTGLCQINAVFGMRIAESRLQNKKLKILVERKSGWDFKEVDLGLVYTLKSRSKSRKSQQIEQLTPDEEDRLEVEIEAPDDSVAATVLLRTRKSTVDQTTVFHPALNPRFSLYELFDKNLDRMGQCLSVEGDSSGNFEMAVESLLFLCGYSMVPFVRNFHQQGRTDVRGIDCLALDSRRKLLVIECTTGPFDTDKLEKLRYRNNSVHDAGHDSLPVLFTTLARASVGDDAVRKAHQNKIAIVAREDTEALLSMAKANVNLDEITNFIYKRIPSSFPSR